MGKELTFPESEGTNKGVKIDPSQTATQVNSLVNGARLGDATSYRELYRIHVDRIHRTVNRLAGPGTDIEDLVQMTFIEGFRSLPAFRGEALFSTWLTRIAVRVCIRANKRQPIFTRSLVDTEDGVSPSAGPDRRAEAREGLVLLNKILNSLSQKRRTAFVLHVLEGYSMEDVAAMVEASVSAVKVRVFDARKEVDRQIRQDPSLQAFLLEGKA